MNPIIDEKINKELSKEWQYGFDILNGGIYLIEIQARAKSWWQNLKSLKLFFGDDDLAVKIDDIIFPKLNNKRGLFDSEMSWNGNNLKGLLKTNIFVIYLEKGEHTLYFSNNQNPFLENIKIFKIESVNQVKYLPTEDYLIEKGDRRPFLSMAFVDFSVLKLKINISAGKDDKSNKDDEDVKLIIDGKIQQNNQEKSHKNWYWCGKILKGEQKEFNENINLDKGIHYIELYADGSPVLNKIEVQINRKKIEEIPTVDNPKWTGDFNDDTEQMILARLIFGEAENQIKEAKIGVGFSVLNRVKKHKKHWGYTIHEAILKEYQYDSFWNMNTKDKVRNPLKDSVNLNLWNESYKVSDIIIYKKIIDPTFGATHFHSFKNKIDFPDWATEENFKIKIDEMYFYELEA